MEFKYWSYLLNKPQNTESLQPSSVMLSGSLIVLFILSMRSGRPIGWLLEDEIVLESGQDTVMISGRAKAPAQGPSLLDVCCIIPLRNLNKWTYPNSLLSLAVAVNASVPLYDDHVTQSVSYIYTFPLQWGSRSFWWALFSGLVSVQQYYWS